MLVNNKNVENKRQTDRHADRQTPV